MLHMVHLDHLDQMVGQNILHITHIQEKEVIFIKNQHQYIDQFINHILIFNTWEVTSVGYHKQFLKD